MAEEEKDIIHPDVLPEEPIASAEEEYRFEWSYAKQTEYDRIQQKKAQNRGAWIFAAVMAATFLLCIALLVGVILLVDHGDGNASSLPTETVAEAVKPQTVLIQSGNAEGTGFFIRSDGYIATNQHVIEDPSAVTVTLYSGQTVSATVIGYSVADDLAVLKIEGENYPAASIGNSDAMRVGSTAIAVGNPMGSSYAWSVTQGIISSTYRIVAFSDDVASYEVKMMQMDTPVNTGNSGGPLCNDRGEVIGIVTRKATGYDDIGLALPINEAWIVLNEIMKNGSADGIDSPLSRTRPTLGISGISVTAGKPVIQNGQETVASHNGVLIVVVTSNLPADGNMQVGDIIVSLNDKEISDMDDLTDVLFTCKPGQTVNFAVARNGQIVSGTVTFQSQK
ncbi:MAG: trypsin-like peptidase domain-containing protein [Clostridia bacterium]|nr:trypsin-like peptidase domain-containing protein [Clostridia bacterium]